MSSGCGGPVWRRSPPPGYRAGAQELGAHVAAWPGSCPRSDVFPLAEEPRSLNVPIVFATGYERRVLPPQFQGDLRFDKPTEIGEVVEALRRVLTDQAARP